MTAGYTAPLFSVETARPGCVERALLIVAGTPEGAIAAALVERPDAEIVKTERSGDILAIEAHELPLPFFLVTPVEGLALGVAATTAARALELAKHRCPELEVQRVERCGTLVAVPPGCPAIVYEMPTGASASFELTPTPREAACARVALAIADATGIGFGDDVIAAVVDAALGRGRGMAVHSSQQAATTPAPFRPLPPGGVR